MFKDRVGDFTTDEPASALLTDRSPLSHVANIKRPLLIGQGRTIPRQAGRGRSDRLGDGGEAHSRDVRAFPDEGHGFARPENRMSFYAVSEAFYRAPGGPI